MMLESILFHLHNWFIARDGVHVGQYSVDGGTIDLPFMKDGQYFRVIGSIFNDGVYQYPATNLTDESFVGEIWAMAVPPSVIALSSEIEDWCEKNPDSAFSSESFGGYSYSKGSNSKTGMPATWQDVFRHKLNAWRKLY